MPKLESEEPIKHVFHWAIEPIIARAVHFHNGVPGGVPASP